MFRWWTLVVLMAAVGSSGYYRRRARQTGPTIARREEGAAMIAGRLVVALPLFLAPLIYVVNPRWMQWASLPLPVWLRWTGLGVALATVPAVHWVLTALGRNVSETVLTKADHELVTRGPYHWVRHPLYTTGLALFIGIGLMQASWFVLLMAGVAMLAIRLIVIPREERALMSRFGARYAAYAAHTGTLLPRASRKPRA
jgi:protein-S-isoprenylcysteine O-methyltransferase Ste14